MKRPRRPARPAAPTLVDHLESRSLLSAVSFDPASVDGIGNNVDNPEYGSTDVQLLRISDAEYTDGIASPAGADRPDARTISNAIAAQTESRLNNRFLTDYLWIWGQFLDHDIDLTEAAEPHEEFNIAVPQGDPLFDPFGTGEAEIALNRSISTEGDNGVRQQINQITAFIDGSVVYGSDQTRADELRTFEGGLLKTSAGNLLPFNTAGLTNAGGTDASLFLAGDIRANENAVLTSMHTLFVREHNRTAAEIAEQNPALSDEEIYQQARSIVTARIQVITFNEFLPALLGPDAVGEYAGYDGTINPGITNEFSTAAYRFGHTLLSPDLQRLDADGGVAAEGNLPLQDAFFSPDEVIDHGIDSLLRGAATQLAQEVDTQIVDDVRNFLFGPPGAGGLDLASLNIQRGRDHGLASYNQVRADLGLAPVNSFDEITSDPDLALALEETYGSVDHIDLWVGGLAEDHLPGSSMGETFTTIIVDQFERLRAGDRYWYQNVFHGRQLAEIENTSLADIIERNTEVTGLQENVFFARGTEQLTVNLERHHTDAVHVELRDDRIVVTNTVTNQEIVSRPAAEVASLHLQGRDGTHNRFTVAPSVVASQTGLQLRVTGGDSRHDHLVVEGTRQMEEITVAGDQVDFGQLDLVFQDVELLSLDGNGGGDQIEVAENDAVRVLVDASEASRRGRQRSVFEGDGPTEAKRPEIPHRRHSRPPETLNIRPPRLVARWSTWTHESVSGVTDPGVKCVKFCRFHKPDLLQSVNGC